MATIYDWSTTAADNDDAGTPINWQENQLPATVNNSAREVMKQVADWRNLLGGAKISATADTMTLTSGMALTAYSQGQMFAFECGVTNTTGCTINVDSIGAKDIKKHKTVALVAGDLVAGGIYIIAYEATAGNFQLLSPTSVDDTAALAVHIADTSTHGISSAIVGTTETQTLTNKTLVAASNTITTAATGNLTATELNTALAELQTDIDTRLTAASSDTLTNKGINLNANTVTGTLAEFNTAVSNATLASLAGSETLSNKTLTSPVLNGNLSGTAFIDDDTLQSASATSAASSESVKAYVDALPGTVGALAIGNNLSDVSNVATSRSNLGLVIGTNVLAPNGDGSSLTGVDPQLGFKNVSSWADSAVETVTLNPAASAIGKADVSVWEEIPDANKTNSVWDIVTNELGFDLVDSAYSQTLTPAAITGTSVEFTMGGGTFAATDVAKRIVNQSTSEAGEARIVSVNGAVATCEITINFTNTDAIASGDWALFSGEFTSGSFALSTSTGAAANREETGIPTVFNSGSVNEVATVSISATQSLICFRTAASDAGQAVIATINGNFVSFGTAVTFSSIGYNFSVALLSSTKAIVGWEGSSVGQAAILTLSDFTISVGTAVTFNSGSTGSTAICSLTDTKAIIVYGDGGNSTYGTSVLLDINGTSITANSEVIYNSNNTQNNSIQKLTSTKAIVAYRDATNSKGNAVILDVSGSTITPATPVTFEQAAAIVGSVVVMTATQAVVAYQVSSTNKSCVLNISTSTINPGTAFTHFTENGNGVTAAKISASELLVTTRDGNYTYYQKLTVANSLITTGPVEVLNTLASAPDMTALSSTKFFVALAVAGNGYGQVIDLDHPVGASVTPPMKFTTVTGIQPVSTVQLSSTKAVVSYTAGGNTGKGTAVVLDIVDNFLVAGTPVVFRNGATYEISSVALTSTTILVTYRDYTSSRHGTAVVLTVSGTSISTGTPVVFESADTSVTSVDKLTSTKAIVAYKDQGNSGFGTACILDISGTSITANTPVVFESASCTHIKLTALSTTKAIVSYRDAGNSNHGTACVLTVSSSSISAGTPSVYNAADGYGTIIALNSTKALVAYKNAGNGNRGTAQILTISGASISAGAKHVYFGGTCATETYLNAISETEVLLDFAANGNIRMYITLNISGTTVTSGDPIVYTDNAQHSSMTIMSATKRIVAYGHNQDNEYGKARIIDLDATYKSSNGRNNIDDVVFEAASSNYIGVAKISDTKAVVSYSDIGDSGYGKAVVVDVSGGRLEFGTPRAVNATNTQFTSIAVLSPTHFIMSYKNLASSDRPTVIALNLTSNGMDMNKGTAVEVATTGSSWTHITAMSATTAMIVYNNASTSGKAAFMTLSGTSITVNSTVVFNAANTSGASVSRLSDTQAIATYEDVGGSSHGRAATLNVSGTTVSAGAEALFDGAAQQAAPSVAPLTATKAIVCFTSGGKAQAKVLDVSGTGITAGSVLQFATVGGAGGRVVAITSTRAVYCYDKSYQQGIYQFLDISSSSVTASESERFGFAGNEVSSVNATFLNEKQVLVAYKDNGNGSYGTVSLIDKLSSPAYLANQYVTTISGSDSVDTTFYSDWNSTAITESLSGQTAVYAFSTNSTPSASTITGGTFGIIGSGQTAVRKIASSLNAVHGGTDTVWFINTNSTYGSETWAAATTNEAKAAIQQASATSANQMTGTAFAAISDSNLPAFGTQFSISITLFSSDSTATPSVDSVVFNYDGDVINREETDQYTIEMPSTNTIRVTAPSSGTSRNARIYISK